MLIPLSNLGLGEQGRVVQVEARDTVGLRILEMGLTPGLIVRKLGVAPLGDPLIFEVRGYRLSLRRSEADLVAVERI
jgi:ferrous iron transport protein A